MSEVHNLYLACYVALAEDGPVVVAGNDCHDPMAIIETIRLCLGSFMEPPYREEVEAYAHEYCPDFNFRDNALRDYCEDMPLEEQAWWAWEIMNRLFGTYPAPVSQFD